MRSGKTIAAFRAIVEAILQLRTKGTHILFSAETVQRELTLYEELFKFQELFRQKYSILTQPTKELISLEDRYNKLKNPPKKHDYINKYIKGDWFKNIHFSCYTGNNRVEELHRKYGDQLVVIIDEIHDSATGVYSHLMAYTDEHNIPTIGLTGTTRSSTKINRENISENATFSYVAATKEMIYEEYNMPIIYSYTAEQAVEDGLWPKFDLIVVDHYLSSTPSIDGTKKGKPHKYSEREYYDYNNGLFNFFKTQK